jgi:hypothetical protein
MVQKQYAEYSKLKMNMLMSLSVGEWTAILAVIVTIIGGIIVPIILHNRPKTRNRGQDVINQGSLTKYINTSARVEELCKRVASTGNSDNNKKSLGALLYPFIIDELFYLGLQTITDIDSSIKKHEDIIVRFAKALYKEKIEFSKGDCIKVLCDFLMAQNRSVEQIVKYYDENSLNLPKERELYAREIKEAYKITIRGKL